MHIGDFNIQNFNRTAAESVKKQDLNFCQAVSLCYDANLSITAKYTPTCFGDQFACLSPSLSPVLSNDFSAYYYGVAPKIDSFTLIDAISALRFSTRQGLDSFIAEYCSCFMLHADQGAYLADFARHAVLTVTRKYGLRLSIPKPLRTRLCALEPSQEIVCMEKELVALHGCPTPEILALLADLRFSKEQTYWQAGEQGLTLRQLYEDPENITLLSGRVFYSGVLIKPVMIHPPKERFENVKVKNICIDFERTTFAAVCALDEVHVEHPLLKESRENLIDFLSKDDQQKILLEHRLSAAPTEEAVRLAVNDYLSNCYNVNQIGVSSNLVSGGNTLLLGLRDNGNIDEGCLYPGVNGNAEIRDDDVAFYSYSTTEDEPAIDIGRKRIDFVGEIAREMYGEIRLDSHNSNWLCYGMTLSGRIPKEPISSAQTRHSNRRLHFNIFFEFHTELNPEQIQEHRNKATESYETTFFKGMKISFYKNGLDLLLQSIAAFFKWILSQREVVESVALILLVVMSFSDKGGGDLSWVDYCSFFLAVLVTIITAVHLVRFLHQRSTWRRKCLRKNCLTKHLRLYRSDSYDKLCKKLDRLLDGKYHPAAYAAAKLFIENLIFDRISQNKKD